MLITVGSGRPRDTKQWTACNSVKEAHDLVVGTRPVPTERSGTQYSHTLRTRAACLRGQLWPAQSTLTVGLDGHCLHALLAREYVVEDVEVGNQECSLLFLTRYRRRAN